MSAASMYLVLLCFLTLHHKGLGFNIQRELYEDSSDSLDDEQREIINKRQFWPNMQNLNSAYSKDASNIYFMGKKLGRASVLSFKPLSDGYAKDNWKVYYMGQEVPEGIPASFQVLSDGYAKDSFNIYFMGQNLPDASVLSFETIGNGYAKDNWSVYYWGQKMQGVSPNSFSINNSW